MFRWRDAAAGPATASFINARASQLAEVIDMARGRPHKCPYCEATKSVAKGFRYNRSGKVRLRRCRSCGRRWTVGPVPEEPSNTKSDAPGGEDTRYMTNSEERPADAGVSNEQERDESEKQERDSTQPEEDRRIELPLSGEGSPSHEDPGKGKETESEETFFTQ